VNNKNTTRQIVGFIIVSYIITVNLTGCTETSSINDNTVLEKFLGTWTGNMKWTGNMRISMFGPRGNHSDWGVNHTRENGSFMNRTDFQVNRTDGNITQLEFTADILYMTITTLNGTEIISQTYKLEENQIILSIQSPDERPDIMQSPFEGEQPPFEEGQPPFEDGQLPDREWPDDAERPNMTIAYNYYFNEEYNVLYLDGTEFVKIK